MIVRVGNMYCENSRKIVAGTLESVGLIPVEVNQGSVVLTGTPDESKLNEFDRLIRKEGMAVLSGTTDALVDSVKMHAWNYLHFPEEPRMKFSAYLEQRLEYKYNYLSNVFSEVVGVPVTTYLKHQKIEMVKKLVIGGTGFGEIARRLNYANLSHLSYVFKKATGQTLSGYRKDAIE